MYDFLFHLYRFNIIVWLVFQTKPTSVEVLERLDKVKSNLPLNAQSSLLLLTSSLTDTIFILMDYANSTNKIDVKDTFFNMEVALSLQHYIVAHSSPETLQVRFCQLLLLGWQTRVAVFAFASFRALDWLRLYAIVLGYFWSEVLSNHLGWSLRIGSPRKTLWMSISYGWTAYGLIKVILYWKAQAILYNS